MAAIKGKNTNPEMVVRRLLHGLGHRYRLHGKALPGCPDLVFPRRRKAIDVMVEKGLMERDAPALAERLHDFKTKRSQRQRQIDGGSASNPAQRNILTEAKVARMAEAVRGALQDASPERREAYLKLFVDKVIVSKQEIRISGPKEALALAAARGLPDTTDGVITFGLRLASRGRR